MNYYTINVTSAKEVIGNDPQTLIEPNNAYNPNLPEHYWNVRYYSFPNFEPKLRLVMNKKSIQTDCIYGNTVPFGMIINNRFKEILKQHHLPPYRFYPIDVYQKGEKLVYYWFHYITTNFLDWVDKDASSVLIRPVTPGKRHEVLGSFDLKASYDERIANTNNLPFMSDLYWEKLKFNNQFPEYDIFYTNDLKWLTLISEDLKKALESSGITGLEYTLFDKIVS